MPISNVFSPFKISLFVNCFFLWCWGIWAFRGFPPHPAQGARRRSAPRFGLPRPRRPGPRWSLQRRHLAAEHPAARCPQIKAVRPRRGGAFGTRKTAGISDVGEGEGGAARGRVRKARQGQGREGVGERSFAAPRSRAEFAGAASLVRGGTPVGRSAAWRRWWWSWCWALLWWGHSACAGLLRGLLSVTCRAGRGGRSGGTLTAAESKQATLQKF